MSPLVEPGSVDLTPIQEQLDRIEASVEGYRKEVVSFREELKKDIAWLREVAAKDVASLRDAIAEYANKIEQDRLELSKEVAKKMDEETYRSEIRAAVEHFDSGVVK